MHKQLPKKPLALVSNWSDVLDNAEATIIALTVDLNGRVVRRLNMKEKKETLNQWQKDYG